MADTHESAIIKAVDDRVTIIGIYNPEDMSSGCYLHTHGLEEQFQRKELVIAQVPFMFVPSGTQFLKDVMFHILKRDIRIFHGYCLEMGDVVVKFHNSIGCRGNRSLEIRDHAKYYNNLQKEKD